MRLPGLFVSARLGTNGNPCADVLEAP